MEELWRETSELLWQRPLLWLPVLAADLLGFLVNLGSGALLRAMVLGRLQYQSALGGAPVRAPLSPAALQHATMLAVLITWPANFLRLLLYATAFFVTAALVRAFASRSRKPGEEIASALRKQPGNTVALSARALVIYACAAVLLNLLGKSLIAHGHRAVLANGWLETGAGVLLFAALATLVAPAAVRALLSRTPRPQVNREAQAFAFLLGLISLALARFVSGNMRSVHIASPVARTLLELTGSWIAALPYALLFVLLARLAFKAEAEPDTATREADLPRQRMAS